MGDKRKIDTLSDSDDEIYDEKRQKTSIYNEIESSGDKGISANNDNEDGPSSFSGYSDYSRKLMVKNLLIIM
jgi:hypothetical protein